MAEAVEVSQDKPCCAAWKTKYSKLMEKYSKLDFLKNKLSKAASTVNKEYGVLDKEHENLKQVLAGLEAQVSRGKDEKEKESGIRIDLEDEVSALQNEIKVLKRNVNSTSEEENGKLKKRLDLTDKDINRTKDLLQKEKKGADLEKKNADMQRKKADDALKKIVKASEEQVVANIEKKKAGEARVLLEKLKKENDALKSTWHSESFKSEAAAKKLEAEKQNTITERKRADLAVAKAEEQRDIAEMTMKEAEEYKLLWEKMKKENDALKSTLRSERSKFEATAKELEAEKQNTITERKRADLAVAKAEEQQEIAENIMKKADKYKLLWEKMKKEVDAVKSILMSERLKSEAEKLKLSRGKERAELAMAKAEEQRKFAETNLEKVRVEKNRADVLNRKLEEERTRVKKLEEELCGHVCSRKLIEAHAGASDIYNNTMYETDTVKILKKQLKLEKMLAKHAKKATKLEVFRNNMLHQELLHLKQEVFQFQQRLDMLDDGFLDDGEGKHELEKMGNQTLTRGKFCSDQFHGQLTSGTDSRLNHACRGSKRNILQTSAINSRSASISDQALVTSSTRDTFSVMASAKLGEDMSALEPTIKLPVKKRTKYIENYAAKAAKLNKLHGLLSDQKDELTEEIPQENSCGKHVKPFKRRNTSCGGAIVAHPLHGNGNLTLRSDNDGPDVCLHVESPVTDIMKLDQRLESREDDIVVSKQYMPTESGDMEIFDYMKLLELDNASDEKSYCRAIASPLSPTLPDIEIYKDDSVEHLKNTDLKNYCVISSDNKDSDSILRIIQTINSCMPQCSLIGSEDLFLRSLLTILNAEDISMKERVCVFFCIILHAICEVGTENLTNSLSNDVVQSLASITLPIGEALSELSLRTLFMESCDLYDLLALVEEFVQQRKVLFCAFASAKTHSLCSPKLTLNLNGNAISLFEETASAHQLVIAGSLLASMCSAFDHIGFVCETSCNIFSMDKFDPALALAVLHAFAHTCGFKYFTLHDFALAMTVIKSLIAYLEKQTSFTNFWSCGASCPFSEGALSVEGVASLLVDKLQIYKQSVYWIHDPSEVVNSLVHRVCPREEHIDVGPIDENFLGFIDDVSLVEILASVMGWDWTNDNFIGKFCELLELRLMEDSSAAIIVLLGQLGRLGVVASGYEGTRIKELRERLSAFSHKSNFSKLSLVTQIALMTALLGLSPVKFEEIVQGKGETSLALSKSIDSEFVKKWFSLLSKDIQSFFKLQQVESETKCSDRFVS